MNILKLKAQLILLHDWLMPRPKAITYTNGHPWSNGSTEDIGNNFNEAMSTLKELTSKIDDSLFEPYSFQWVQTLKYTKQMVDVIIFDGCNNYLIRCFNDIINLQDGSSYVSMRKAIKTKADFLGLLKLIEFKE